MPTLTWQKSSYCPEGNSCVQVAATPETIHITESSDPSGAILTATPAAFGTLLAALKHEPPLPHPSIHVTSSESETVRIHSTAAPQAVVTTDRPKWNAFVRGVRAGEFDHLAQPTAAAEQALSRSYAPADGLRFDVAELSVEHHPDRSATLTYGLTVVRHGHPDERWLVTLPWEDKSWADVLTSAAPPADRLGRLVHLVHAHLEEWWDTKGHNRVSAKMGRRLT